MSLTPVALLLTRKECLIDHPMTINKLDSNKPDVAKIVKAKQPHCFNNLALAAAANNVPACYTLLENIQVPSPKVFNLVHDQHSEIGKHTAPQYLDQAYPQKTFGIDYTFQSSSQLKPLKTVCNLHLEPYSCKKLCLSPKSVVSDFHCGCLISPARFSTISNVTNDDKKREF
ncbi:hypothetical protein DFH28DRAFT_929675 [Melampsora americana]|nr:hypothetical protein DFH28DRAFT_929675 [Melampsora americana]